VAGITKRHACALFGFSAATPEARLAFIIVQEAEQFASATPCHVSAQMKLWSGNSHFGKLENIEPWRTMTLDRRRNRGAGYRPSSAP
jgi:hypothetical protein